MQIILKELAERLGGEVVGDNQIRITGAAPFEFAGPDEITYAFRPGYLKKIDQTEAAVVIVPENSVSKTSAKTVVKVPNPYAAFAKTLQYFCPPTHPDPGIHPTAVVDPSVVFGDTPGIGAGAIMEKNVVCGDRVHIHPGVYVGPNVQIGDDAVLYPNVTVLKNCRIGDRVMIHSGAVIGADGFGFAPDEERYEKIPHFGTVVIEEDVEIGANTAIDRATFGETRIGKGVKIDNLVHVAHNVVVGENTVLVAQVGIAGSCKVGKHVILAGQAAVSHHLEIGDGAVVGPQAGLAKSVAPGETVSGSPEMPHRLWLRVQRIIPRLPELMKRLKALERKITPE